MATCLSCNQEGSLSSRLLFCKQPRPMIQMMAVMWWVCVIYWANLYSHWANEAQRGSLLPLCHTARKEKLGQNEFWKYLSAFNTPRLPRGTKIQCDWMWDYFFSPSSPTEVCSSVIVSSLTFYGNTNCTTHHTENMFTHTSRHTGPFHLLLQKNALPQLPRCVLLLIRFQEDNELLGWPSLAKFR